jgi:hypothetical protein
MQEMTLNRAQMFTASESTHVANWLSEFDAALHAADCTALSDLFA